YDGLLIRSSRRPYPFGNHEFLTPEVGTPGPGLRVPGIVLFFTRGCENPRDSAQMGNFQQFDSFDSTGNIRLANFARFTAFIGATYVRRCAIQPGEGQTSTGNLG